MKNESVHINVPKLFEVSKLQLTPLVIDQMSSFEPFCIIDKFIRIILPIGRNFFELLEISSKQMLYSPALYACGIQIKYESVHINVPIRDT